MVFEYGPLKSAEVEILYSCVAAEIPVPGNAAQIITIAKNNKLIFLKHFSIMGTLL